VGHCPHHPAALLCRRGHRTGLIVVKHRRRRDSGKYVNVAVLEGDRVKVIDERASAIPDCPTLLSTLLRL
jgi:hypothetical protein